MNVYDFDNTILRGDSTALFYLYCLRRTPRMLLRLPGLAFGALFGFVGMLLSVPVFALIYAIVRTIVAIQLKKRDLPTDSASYIGAPDNIPKDKNA